MPRKGSQSAHDKGRPQNGRPFDAKKRAEFVEKIGEGASIRAACRLVGVSKKTVAVWMKSGRAGARAEHAVFARQVEEALERGTHEVRKRAYTSNEPKVMVEILKARDPDFGDLDLRRRKMLVEIRAAEADVALREILLEKARKGDEESPLGFGLAVLLGDPALSETFKDELVRFAIAKGFVMVERAKLAGPPAEPVA